MTGRDLCLQDCSRVCIGEMVASSPYGLRVRCAPQLRWDTVRESSPNEMSPRARVGGEELKMPSTHSCVIQIPRTRPTRAHGLFRDQVGLLLGILIPQLSANLSIGEGMSGAIPTCLIVVTSSLSEDGTTRVSTALETNRKQLIRLGQSTRREEDQLRG